MPATTKTPLGATTLNRDWYVDIDSTPLAGTSTWVPVLGIQNFVPSPDNAGLQDDSDFDSGGYGSQNKTTTAWSATATLLRKVTAADATAYDPGQELLRAASIGKVGAGAVVHVRYYEMTPDGPRVEAYSGYAVVQWAPQGGDTTADNMVAVTLTGRGQLAQVAHPDTGSAVPTISAVQVSGATATTIPAAGGSTVRITGNHFTGTTSITFAGTSAPNFIVASDGVIQVTAPAHTAGAGNLVVTNAAGASAGFPITFV